MAVVTMRQLLESGVHFGHQTRRWNPKMKRFIMTERNGIYIIDLQQSVTYINSAYEFVKETVAHGGTVLFVGTKKQAQEAIAEQATRVGMPYVNQRWLGGMLTNFKTVKTSIKRLKDMEQMVTDGTLEKLAMAVIVGCLFGFINSAQQVFEVALGNAAIFPVIFAMVGCAMAAASLLNASLVQRLGQRLLSHTALIGFTLFSAAHFAVALSGHETLVTFAALQALTMFCFGFIGGNFGSMAMTPMGHIAGTAAAVQGVISSVGGALIGFFIGQQFNGTTVPMTLAPSAFAHWQASKPMPPAAA